MQSRMSLEHKVTVHHENEATTIARVTCPTAPSLWRWRDIPLPRVVPRKVELPEDEHGLNEWKYQLAAAIVCGVSALLARFVLENQAFSLGAYLLAYGAGSWFTLGEVWERLRKATIDVHFLMLAVAVGSAAIGAWGEGAMLLFLFSLSGSLEHYALRAYPREIRSLFRTLRKPNGPRCIRAESEVPVEKLVRACACC